MREHSVDAGGADIFAMRSCWLQDNLSPVDFCCLFCLAGMRHEAIAGPWQGTGDSLSAWRSRSLADSSSSALWQIPEIQCTRDGEVWTKGRERRRPEPRLRPSFASRLSSCAPVSVFCDPSGLLRRRAAFAARAGSAARIAGVPGVACVALACAGFGVGRRRRLGRARPVADGDGHRRALVHGA